MAIRSVVTGETDLQSPVAYGVTIAVTLTAIALRWLLDPWLQDRLALVTLYAAVAFAVWFAGYRAAAVSAVLGYVLCDILFIPPRNSFTFSSPEAIIGGFAYLVSSTAIIALGEGMRRAQWRVIAERRRVEGI